MSEWLTTDVLILLSIIVGLPLLIAKFAIRASVVQVLLAFPIFWAICHLGLGFGRISEEVFGWTIIVQMFTAWAGVPLIALGLKLLSFPERLFRRECAGK